MVSNLMITSFCTHHLHGHHKPFLVTFEMILSYSHFQMIFWTSMSLCRQLWMPYG
jgi:hypothetical protein